MAFNSRAKPHSSRKRKPRRLKNLLLLRDKVEVRSKEEGFLGSWHQGTIIQRRRIGYQVKFDVKYDHLIVDDGSSDNVVASVPVSLVVVSDQETTTTTPRGYIRPLPNPIEFDLWRLPFGLCVDVYHNDGWWEGVIFDYDDGSKERKVFFPDLGDEMMAPISALRITQDWDDVTEKWDRRGMWLLLELVEEYRDKHHYHIPVSIQQLWYDLQEKPGFVMIRDWTCSSRAKWESLLFEAIHGNLKIVVKHLFHELTLPQGLEKVLELAKSVGQGSSSYTDSEGVSDEVPIDLSLLCTLDQEQANAIIPSSTEQANAIIPSSIEQANAIIPSSIEQAISASSSRKIKSFCSTSFRPRQKYTWLPAGPDMVQGAKYCPEAIFKCVKRGRATGSRDSADEARQHLLYLKWRIMYYKDAYSIRKRYISPTGKCFDSVVTACRYLIKSEGVNPQLVSSGHEQASTLHDEAAAACGSVSPLHELQQQDDDHHGSRISVKRPDSTKAIVDWLKDPRRGGGKKNRATKKGARDKLAAMGWTAKVMKRGGGKCQWVYKSPMGRLYYSLVEACKSIMDNKKDKSVVASKLARKQSKTTTRWVRRGPTERTEADLGIHKKPGQPTSHIRSRKQARQILELTPAHTHPMTTVSWLIDKNAILPREKVYYRTSKDDHPRAKGKLTREGIKCECCMKVYSLSSFELHVGNTNHRNCHGPANSIFLADGRSLLDCQVQAMHAGKGRCLAAGHQKRLKVSREAENDEVCSYCRHGGKLILCDQCPSSFHGSCLGMKDVPSGDWFCPSCCCRFCKQNTALKDSESFVDDGVLKCTQCEKNYHIACLKNNGACDLDLDHKGNSFCGSSCRRIFDNLSAILGVPVPVGVDDLTWTLLKSDSGDSSIEAKAQSYMKLGIALHIMHECFEPLEESRTRRDIVNDVIFNERSELKRLDFQGFYTVLIEENEEVISVANLRILGESVAEVPLVATRHQHRRRGMCRVIMNVIEEKLAELGVERLVLPAVPNVLNTWTGSFGFSEMADSERLQFADSIFLNFPGTIMCQKLLTSNELTPLLEKEIPPESHHNTCGNGEEMEVELDGSSSLVSEVFQAEDTAQIQEMTPTVHPPPIEEHCSLETDCCRSCSSSPASVEEKCPPGGSDCFIKYFRKNKRKKNM
ncbi:unnamed protein product [Linum tenue]|uniref:Uncharacterized protein n=1 Tax=Linum tenue TaxID=586396 RepID=A0AAV0KU29_9ROSI|nr:unnamed protein product [Linum tenue]